MLPPVKTTCLDHEGSGAVKVQRWDGKAYVQNRYEYDGKRCKPQS